MRKVLLQVIRDYTCWAGGAHPSGELRRKRSCLRQHLKDLLSGRDWQVHAVKRHVAGVGEDLPALSALMALTIFALAEFVAFLTAVVTRHSGLELS